jgi:hypothetical protein
MDQDLAHYLAKKYPLIFPQKGNNSEFNWSFECNSGWFQLLSNSCLQMQSHIDHNNKQYEQNLLYQSYIDNNQLESLPLWLKEKHERGLPLKIGNYCPQIVARQVKEKLGSLRFYCDGGDSFCRGVISLAETMSCSICEECGDEGKQVSKRGYIKVLCKKHALEEKFVIDKGYDSEYFEVLMPGGYQKMNVIHAISETEVIAENKDMVKVHAFKYVHSKIEFWSGDILKE